MEPAGRTAAVDVSASRQVGRGASGSGLVPLALGVGLFLVYTANGRQVGGGDIVPSTLLPLAILRGDGPVLDRFDHLLRTPDGAIPGYAAEERGHIVSRYPLGPGLLAVPIVWPQLAVLDRLQPGWERDPVRLRLECRRMGKNAAAAIAALGAVALWFVLHGLGLGRVALPSALLMALGSDHWAVAGQGLWQHGPAVLCLAMAMGLLMAPGSMPSWRLALAGFVTALMVVCRPIDLVFAATIFAWVLRHQGRAGRWAFTIPAAIVALGLSSYNLWFFDTLHGGYAALERTHSWAHGLEGTWTGHLLGGAAGTLFSPSHGLFVYSPWVALALLALPWSWPSSGREMDRRSTLPRWLLWSLLPYFLLLSKYSCWWGGHTFGPRFWIDAGPIVAVAAAVGLSWAWSRCRPLLGAFAVSAVVAVGIQTVGFLCYPSSWHGTPTNADLHHERLWDWRDNELSRGLNEGIRPREW